MMFLIRTAFWLMIIILLLPTDDRQRSDRKLRRHGRSIAGLQQDFAASGTVPPGFKQRLQDGPVSGMGMRRHRRSDSALGGD